MPAKGQDASFARQHRVSVRLLATGDPRHGHHHHSYPQGHDRPAAGLAKIYVTPERRPTSACPCARSSFPRRPSPGPGLRHDRALHRSDASRSTCARAWRRTRRAWVLARGGVEEYDGRPIQPIDNGNVKVAALQPFPNTPRPLRGLDGKPITQFEWARAGVITKEMIYVADARESRPQARARASPRSGWPTARASAPRCPSSSRPSSCATRWRAAAPSSRPTSTTPSSSR